MPVRLTCTPLIRAQLEHSDKLLFVFVHGPGEDAQGFEVVQTVLDLSDSEFANDVWVSTVINTNLLRLLDNPMTEGLIYFNHAGQMCIVPWVQRPRSATVPSQWFGWAGISFGRSTRWSAISRPLRPHRRRSEQFRQVVGSQCQKTPDMQASVLWKFVPQDFQTPERAAERADRILPLIEPGTAVGGPAAMDQLRAGTT